MLWLAEALVAWAYVNMVVMSRCFTFRRVIMQAQICKSFWVENLTSLNLEKSYIHAVSIFFSVKLTF